MPRSPIRVGWRSSTCSCLPTLSSELQKLLSMPSNLMAHHLGVLEQAGMLRRVRSEGDRRRTYLQLIPETLEVMVPSAVRRCAERVVFVCSQNSARSQFAVACGSVAARYRRRRRGPIPPPPSIRVRSPRLGVGTYRCAPQPRHLDDVVCPGDLVVAVCDNAQKNYPPTWIISTGRFPIRSPPLTPTCSTGPSTT